MAKSTNSWLKKIFSVSTLVATATIVGACISVIQYTERNGGTFVALVNNEEQEPPIKKNIVIFMSNDSLDLSRCGVFPQLKNPAKYALQDVNVTYIFNLNRVKISYTDYFNVHKTQNEERFENIDKTLYPKSDFPEPFYSFVMYDKSTAHVKIRGTYKGVEDPFLYDTQIIVKKVNNFESINYAYLIDKINMSDFKDPSLQLEVYCTDGNEISHIQNYSERKEVSSKKQTFDEVKEESRKVTLKIQENNGTPWYMYIVGVILFVILLVSSITFIFCLFINCDKDSDSTDITRSIIITPIAAVLMFFSLKYNADIFDLSNKYSTQDFIYCIISTVAIILASLLTGLIMKKCLNKIKDEDNDWTFFILAILSFLFIFIGLYAYKIILS